MHTAEGIILLVQEGRFMLQTDDGDHRLFVLSHRAGLEPQQLAPLQRQQARVRVRYQKARNMIAASALALERLSAQEGPA